MKKIEAITNYKWKPDIEERLGIKDKPFIRVSFRDIQKEKYYLYGGIFDNKLELYYRSNTKPDNETNKSYFFISYIAIAPEELIDDVQFYSNESEDKLILIPIEDLIETTIVEMNFRKEIPYKIVSRYDKMVYYGFFIAMKSRFASFYCFSEHILSKLFTKSFSIEAYDFYEFD